MDHPSLQYHCRIMTITSVNHKKKHMNDLFTHLPILPIYVSELWNKTQQDMSHLTSVGPWSWSSWHHHKTVSACYTWRSIILFSIITSINNDEKCVRKFLENRILKHWSPLCDYYTVLDELDNLPKQVVNKYFHSWNSNIAVSGFLCTAARDLQNPPVQVLTHFQTTMISQSTGYIRIFWALQVHENPKT